MNPATLTSHGLLHTPRIASQASGHDYLRSRLGVTVPHTPRTESPCVSPRFVRAFQPQKQDDFLGRRVSLEERCLGLYRAPDGLDIETVHDVLVRWLNEEVRDRLDSIDRRLQELRETRAPDRNISSMITQVAGHSLQEVRCTSERSRASDLECPQTSSAVAAVAETSKTSGLMLPIRTVFPQTSNTVAAVAETSKTSGSMLPIRTVVTEVIHHVRGRHAAAVWCFLEYRFSSSAAYVWSFVIPSLVFVSIFLSFRASVDDEYAIPKGVGFLLHTIIELVFTSELSLRFFACPDRRIFCQSPMNVIDLCTCLPLVIRLVGAILGKDGSWVSKGTLCLLPSLRLLKLSRRFEKFQLLCDAFLIALEALPVLLYTMLLIAVAFSGLIYTVEPRENISNLPHAMWFVLVTMTTCGYGDVSPSTLLGKLISSLLMVVSILYTAMPIGIVGNAFSQAWDARDRLLLMQRVRESFLQQGFNEAAFRDMVSQLCHESDDRLGFEQFQSALQRMGLRISSDRVFMLFSHLDRDGNGKINTDELLSGLFPHDYAQYLNNLRTSINRTGGLSQCETPVL